MFLGHAVTCVARRDIRCRHALTCGAYGKAVRLAYGNARHAVLVASAWSRQPFMVLDLTFMVLDLSGQPSLVLDLRLRRIHPCTFTNLTFRLPRCMEPQNGQAPS